jgi:hypothetical protein
MSVSVRVAAAAALVVVAQSASAVTIDYTDIPNGGNATNLVLGPVSVAITAPVRQFEYKTVNSVTGVGISGGAVTGEIDNDESIDFAFSEGVYLNSLQICFLYTDGNFGDVIDEIAKFVTDAGTWTLTATSATVGTWTGPAGIVSNVSIATEAGGASWIIDAPGTGIFGDAITSLSLQSGFPSTESKKADYAFQSLDFSREIPAPGAMACMTAAGMLALPRRRKA